MPEVLIDANVILDARNRNAERHETALKIFQGIDRGELPRARVTNYTVPEVLHPIQKRVRKEIAVETLDRLQESRGFDLVQIPQSVQSEGERIFRMHEDGGPEWVDSILAAYMGSENLEYIYSFDDDFDRIEGISRLRSASNPFN